MESAWRDLVEGVRRGVDMFDCVIPTRNARTGFLYTHDGIIRIRNSRYTDDTRPLAANCGCYCCRSAACLLAVVLDQQDQGEELENECCWGYHELHDQECCV